MSRHSEIALSFVLLIFFSCSSAYEEYNYTPITQSELKEKINTNSRSIQTFEASGNISFDSPERSGSAWFEVKIKKPDTLQIKLEGPFGISIASALITRNSFIYYNAQENIAITGPSSDMNIGAILRIKVSFDELINGLSSGFTFNTDNNDSSLANIVSKYYMIKNTVNADEVYFINPGDFTISRYKRYGRGDTTEVEVIYSSYVEKNIKGVMVKFPVKIIIANRPKKQILYIDYQNTELNNSDISFKIKIPSSAKIIKWD